MLLAERVDIYCERTEWGMFAEPLNALTNAAFFAAAVLILAAATRRGIPRRGVTAIFAAMVASVGAASLAFHLLAVEWAGILDSISIAAFVLYYLWIYLRQVFGMPPLRTAALLALLLLSTAAFILCGAALPLNGSEQYLGVLSALIMLALSRQTVKAKQRLLLAAGLFTLSVVFRSIDAWSCSLIPSGTHFLWHILNGTVCFLAADAYLAARSDSLRNA